MSALLALLLAVPADARLPLATRIVKAPDVTAVACDPPLVCELLPTAEVLLDPKGAAPLRAFLFVPHEVRVIELGPAPEPVAKPSGAIADEKSYQAWRAYFAAGGSAQLVYEPGGLQAQARAAQKLLAAAGLGHVEVGFSAFGARLKGARDEAEKRRAVMAIWPAVLGPLRVDD